MLLKITEKIIRRNVFEQRKESRVNRYSAFEQLRPVIAASIKQNVYLHTRRTLASVSSDYKHLTPNHTISFQNLFIMIHSLNRGFPVHNPYVQNMP